MPDGAVLLNADNVIVWANPQFLAWCREDDFVGRNFYEALDNPEILGPDFCPFHTALATGQPSTSTLRSGENCYLHVHSAPVAEGGDAPEYLIVTVADVTREVLQQQKLEAIHKAGIELADLSPDEIFNMTVEDRIELLKSNILHQTQHLLSFDVIEIRLLDQATRHLTPLLSVGIDQEAADRALYARPQHNGVTGFVAATGKSYPVRRHCRGSSLHREFSGSEELTDGAPDLPGSGHWKRSMSRARNAARLARATFNSWRFLT